MKVHIITFGCRSNQCDSRWISESLERAGCEIVDDVETAEALIVNTCAVTAESDRQGRQALRRARRENPHAVIIATGCAVQVEPSSFLGMVEIDYVSSFDTKNDLGQLVGELRLRSSPRLLHPIDSCRADCFFGSPSDASTNGHTRVPLKIQEGCDNRCAYCVVWKVRGKSRSMPPETAINHLKALGAHGVKEVVLTGIHLGGWGRDLEPPRTLESFLRRVLQQKYVERIRLSSIDPVELTGELLDLLNTEEGLCPHLHLPLQSANDEILKAMGRKYKVREAAVRIRLVKQGAPHAAIGMDYIVGFPGETDDIFESSVRELEDIPFDYLHVFPFSARPGTEAASMPGQVAPDIVRKRGTRLHIISAQRRRAFWDSSLNSVRPVVVETRDTDGSWFGHTDNYIPVIISPCNVKSGDLVPVRLLKCGVGGIEGELAK